MMMSGLRGLAALGLDLPPNSSDEMVDRMVDEVNQLLVRKPISELLNNRAATDDRVIVRAPVFHSFRSPPQDSSAHLL
jgi:hypothetical protein